jgi:hypothetical protein
MFNKLFDFNGDGKLDAGEKALEFMTIMNIIEGSDDDDEISANDKEDD